MSFLGLMERHWGNFQGRDKSHRPTTPDPESVETLEDFHHRILDAVSSIPGPSPVLLVAHSGVFRAICTSVGIVTDDRVSVQSGQVLKMEPPTPSRRNWRISAVYMPLDKVPPTNSNP